MTDDGWEIVKFPRRNGTGKGKAQKDKSLGLGKNISPTMLEGPNEQGAAQYKRIWTRPVMKDLARDKRGKAHAEEPNNIASTSCALADTHAKPNQPAVQAFNA